MQSEEKTIKFTDIDIQEMENQARGAGFSSASEYLAHLHKYYGKAASKIKLQQKVKRTDPSWPVLKHKTKFGRIYQGDSSLLMRSMIKENSIDLVITSPPFGLLKKKSYGNEDADQYLKWFRPFAEGFSRILADSGSLVIDIGGAWQKGHPVRSLYHFELLIMLCREFGFHLVQEFYWWNPAKLPSPAEWVNIRRVRVKDAVNCVWWLAKTPYPKASNKRVLQPYSGSMNKLLKNGYKPKLRPSGHDISDKFGAHNGGAIPPNLIALANTESNGGYQRYCRENNLTEHPARFPIGLPAYFIRMLTDKGDKVFDPFGGSCVSGDAAQRLGRFWTCCELDEIYVKGAIGRFTNNSSKQAESAVIQKRIEPYQIFPPVLDLLSEEESPLSVDGGRKRPKKNINAELSDLSDLSE